MADKTVSILIVDDHEVVRMGLRTLLERRPGFAVVGEACREIREDRPETKVIMLTSYADDEALFGSIMAGASGYLLKQTRGQSLAEGIEEVAQGESLLDPAVTDRVLERVRRLPHA